MERVSKVLIILFLMLAGVVSSIGAQEPSIVDIFVDDDRFETLEAAVIAAGLDGPLSSGEWTVFAPTDDAFAKLDLDASNIGTAMSTEDLADLLLYHAKTNRISSADAKTMLGDVSMANGRVAGWKFFDGSLWINDDSRVIEENINAENGIIHVIDTVILAPWPRDDAEVEAPNETQDNSIASFIRNDEQLSTISALMMATGLDGPLSSGEWTFFAPTNEAYAKLDLNANNIVNSLRPERLEDEFLYNAITGSISPDEAKTMLGDVSMANGRVAGWKFFDGSLWLNDVSRISSEVIMTENGRIYKVDNIIPGLWPLPDCQECTPPEVVCSIICFPGCAVCSGEVVNTHE